MSNIVGQAINNHIIFQFNDEVDHDGKFIDKHSMLHIIAGDFNQSASMPRWGTVVLAGPLVDKDISTPGNQILIENLKWTIGFKIQNQTYWRTDESCVIATRE